jgi:N-acetylglucosaminyl-diphospho-decaprenol L-rhamnosyltransferase
MELSIAINNYRNPELLKLCLNSIRNNVRSIEYEIIVTDSATEEDTEMMMREDYPQVKFFPFKENVGLAAMIKKAIEESEGEYILFLNGDIIVTEHSVEELLGFLKKYPEVGIAGPKLLNFNGALQKSCFRFYRPITVAFRRMEFLGKLKFVRKHLDWFLMEDYDHQKPRNVDWLMGSALMAKKEVIEKIGYMDSQFFMYMEDVDWCRRFWENGYRVVYYPCSLMHHYHGKGSKKGGLLSSLFLNRLTWVHISSAAKYFKKYWGKEIPKYEENFRYE